LNAGDAICVASMNVQQEGALIETGLDFGKRNLVRFEKLSWDSEFFGFNVGRLASGDFCGTAGAIYEAMQREGYRLVYWASLVERPDMQPMHVVDQVLLSAVPSTVIAAPASNNAFRLSSYPVAQPNEQLIKLALQAGWSSRFRMDSRFTREQFCQMYNVWIAQSCLRELADDVIVACEGEDLAGFVTVARREASCHIGLIVVSETHRRRGVGQQLLSAAAQFACSVAATSLQVVTQQNNDPAIRLYESVGFRPTDKKYWYHFWVPDHG
jgi:dTDP-4-amino-4,6-dideoxy-D-galactose acyltransferase